MSSAERVPVSPPSSTQLAGAALPDRRADVEAKQARVAAFLREVDCHGLLLLEPENIAWFTGGASAPGVLDPGQMPGLYLSPEQRWALCSSVDYQRFFDEELDGLGFQLKTWPWHWGREQLLADLCHGRRFACDLPREGAEPAAEVLRALRRVLSPYDQACLRSLGFIVSHALEATCRGLAPGQTERDAAGQVGHRLLHRGAYPVVVSAAADGRCRHYRRCGFTATPVRRSCRLMVTARKYGLHVTASRSFTFGPPEPSLRREQDTACKVQATYLASTWPDGGPREIFGLGCRVYLITGFEHEWLLCPQGHVTGRAAVELPLTPQTEDLLQAGWALTWCASAGAGCSCDTVLVRAEGPEVITPAENWPLKRIRVQGAEFFCPDLLERPPG